MERPNALIREARQCTRDMFRLTLLSSAGSWVLTAAFTSSLVEVRSTYKVVAGPSRRPVKLAQVSAIATDVTRLRLPSGRAAGRGL
jgi:hypothetical protein